MFVGTRYWILVLLDGEEQEAKKNCTSDQASGRKRSAADSESDCREDLFGLCRAHCFFGRWIFLHNLPRTFLQSVQRTSCDLHRVCGKTFGLIKLSRRSLLFIAFALTVVTVWSTFSRVFCRLTGLTQRILLRCSALDACCRETQFPILIVGHQARAARMRHDMSNQAGFASRITFSSAESHVF